MAFNALHTVFEASVNALLATGLCAEINLTMSPNYTIEAGIIEGANYRVECVKPVESMPNGIVTFNPPTEREDGTPLNINEISGYEIEFGANCYSGRTITKDGQKSAAVISCYDDE